MDGGILEADSFFGRFRLDSLDSEVDIISSGTS